MNTKLLVPGIALAIGLGVGIGIGKSGGAKESVADATELEIRTNRMERVGSDGVADADRKKKARSVDEIYRTPGANARIQGLLDYYSNLGAEEFEGEAEKLDELPFNERILASVLLFGKWAEVDPMAAMAFTDTMGFEGALVRPTVLQGWASTDPVNAGKYYTENASQFAMMDVMNNRGGRGGQGGQGAGEIIASEWAKLDPKGAMEWAAGLSNNSVKTMTSVISEVAKSDPSKAAEMVMDMEEGSRGRAYDTIAKQWGADNFTEAMAWAGGLPEASRGEAMAAAIEGLAQKSPELAASEIIKLTDAKAVADAMPTIARNYARLDPVGSMDWLNSVDNDEAKEDSMREVMPIWVSADSGAALAFVQSQSSPDVKDRAARSYIFSNNSASASELAEVATLISDEDDQRRTSGMIAAKWMQEDQKAATEYINGNDVFSDDAKERLISGRGFDRGRGGPRGRR
ncbi:MAG: hypothetical protein ACSHX7_04310 [Luteolibacter sp.]